MKNYSHNSIYDHCVYRSAAFRWGIIISVILAWVLLLIYCGMAVYEILYKGKIFQLNNDLWVIMYGVVILGLTVFAGITAFSRGLIIGINGQGCYIWRYGMIPWSAIRRFEKYCFTYKGSVYHYIRVILQDENAVLVSLPWYRCLDTIGLRIYNRIMVPADHIVIEEDVQTFVPLSQDDLLQLFEKSHLAYICSSEGGI